MNNKIIKLFEKRAQSYDKYTNAIFDAITPTVVAAIIEILGLTEEETARLEWHSLRLVDGQLVLSGIVNYKAGDEVISPDDGEIVVLDEKTALVLSKIIKLALPIQLVETATKEDIKQYIQDLEERFREQYAELYGTDPAIVDLDAEDLEGDTLEEKLHSAVNQVEKFQQAQSFDAGEDFKYNELTKEQQEALQLTIMSQDKKKGTKIN